MQSTAVTRSKKAPVDLMQEYQQMMGNSQFDTAIIDKSLEISRCDKLNRTTKVREVSPVDSVKVMRNQGNPNHFYLCSNPQSYQLTNL